MSFRTYRATVGTPGQPFQVDPTQQIDSGMPVAVKAMRSNSGEITLGHSSAAADATDEEDPQSFPLSPGEGITIRVARMGNIWIDGTVEGDKVAIIVED